MRSFRPGTWLLEVHLFCFAFGYNRSSESGKNATNISGTVLSFFFRVGVSPLVGLRTVMSLVSNLVVLIRFGPAAGGRSSRTEVSQVPRVLEDVEGPFKQDLLVWQPALACIA